MQPITPSAARWGTTRRAVVAMMLREMVTTYGRSPGGYVWAIAEPVAAIGLLSIVFSMAFHAPALGTTFVLFYATAYLPFMLFMDVSGKVAGSIRFSKPLLAYPALTLADVILARFVLNFLTHILVILCVISGVFLIYDLPVHIDFGALGNALAMVGLLALGVGIFNCYMIMAFPVYERIWQVATRPLVIVSGLFFLLESVPGVYRDILWWNPLFHVTGEMRSAFYSVYGATYVSETYVYLLGLGLVAFGLLILKRNYRDFVNM